MINLKANNALDRCTTFDKELDLRRVSKTIADTEWTRVFVRENLDALEKNQGDEDLKKALRKVLSRPPWVHKTKKRFKKLLKGQIMKPE